MDGWGCRSAIVPSPADMPPCYTADRVPLFHPKELADVGEVAEGVGRRRGSRGMPRMGYRPNRPIAFDD